MKSFDQNSYELITHTQALIKKRKTTIEELVQVLQAQRVLDNHHDKGIFLLLVSELNLKLLCEFKIRILQFNKGMFNTQEEKQRKIRNGGNGKSKATRRKRKPLKQNVDKTLQQLAEQALSNPSNVESKNSKQGQQQTQRQIQKQSQKNSQNTASLQRKNQNLIDQGNFNSQTFNDDPNFQQRAYGQTLAQTLEIPENSNTNSTFSNNLQKKREEFYGGLRDKSTLIKRRNPPRGQSAIITKKKRFQMVRDQSITLDMTKMEKIDFSLNQSRISAFKNQQYSINHINVLQKAQQKQNMFKKQQLQQIKKFNRLINIKNNNKRNNNYEGNHLSDTHNFDNVDINDLDYYQGPFINFDNHESYFEDCKVGQQINFKTLKTVGKGDKKNRARAFRELLSKRKQGQIQIIQQNPQIFGDIYLIKV